MELNDKDYMAIANKISEGANYVEYTKGNETLALEYELSIEGYVEDDYFNGTGAFIRTSAALAITSVESWSDEGEDVPNDFDEDKLASLVA